MATPFSNCVITADHCVTMWFIPVEEMNSQILTVPEKTACRVELVSHISHIWTKKNRLESAIHWTALCFDVLRYMDMNDINAIKLQVKYTCDEKHFFTDITTYFAAIYMDICSSFGAHALSTDFILSHSFRFIQHHFKFFSSNTFLLGTNFFLPFGMMNFAHFYNVFLFSSWRKFIHTTDHGPRTTDRLFIVPHLWIKFMMSV